MPKQTKYNSKPGKARAVKQQNRTEVEAEREVGEAVGEETIVTGVEVPVSKKTRQGKAAKQPADIDEESQLVEPIPTDDVTGIIHATCSFLLLFEKTQSMYLKHDSKKPKKLALFP